MKRISVYSEQCGLAGQRLTARDQDACDMGDGDLECRSADHWHLDFGSTEEALQFAAKLEKTDGAPERVNAYRNRVAATIREEVDAQG